MTHPAGRSRPLSVDAGRTLRAVAAGLVLVLGGLSFAPSAAAAAPVLVAGSPVAMATPTPQAPTNLGVSDIGHDRATVTWDPPASGPAPTGYRVVVTRFLGEPGVYQVGPDETSVLATGLDGGKVYTATVFSLQGEWSDGAASASSSFPTRRTVNRPVGAIDTVSVVGGEWKVTGQAADADLPGPVDVRLYVQRPGEPTPAGALWSRAVADLATPDHHGFVLRATPNPYQVPVTGDYTACVYAYDPAESGEHARDLLGCEVVTVTDLPQFADPVGEVESVVTTGTSVVMTGWALEPQGFADVDVAFLVDGAEVLTTGSYAWRADVGQAFPGTGDNHGFEGAFQVPEGDHEVCAYAFVPEHRDGEGVNLGCARVHGVNPLPFGSFDSLTATASTLTLSGWAVDPNGGTPIDVRYSVDRTATYTIGTDVYRPDVAQAYPGAPDRTGFQQSFPVEAGAHTVCVEAIDRSSGVAVPLGCRTVTVAPQPNRLPLANFESLTASGSTVTLSGWGLDLDAPGPIDVHYTVDGGWGGSVTTDIARADVARAYPGAGARQGFSRSFTTGPGTHRVCAYAIDTTTTASTAMGCRTVTVLALRRAVSRW